MSINREIVRSVVHHQLSKYYATTELSSQPGQLLDWDDIEMGEANRRKAEIQKWRSSLSESELKIVDVAIAAHQKIIMSLNATGWCYRIAFFLQEYLVVEHGVEVDAVVGYVNDGETDIMTSHAWVEFRGKKTDISLTLTAHPEVQLTGALLIMDRVFRPGRVSYTYHREKSDPARFAEEELLAYPQFRDEVQRKMAEHSQMEKLAAASESIRTYLDEAPDGLGYMQLKSRLG